MKRTITGHHSENTISTLQQRCGEVCTVGTRKLVRFGGMELNTGLDLRLRWNVTFQQDIQPELH